MKIIFLNFLIVLALSGSTQNLVPNPSFELYNQCPQGPNQVSRCQFWTSFSETPDYYNGCGTNGLDPPDCSLSFQYPHSGNAHIGFYTFVITMSGLLNNREIIGSQLLTPLVKGQEYFISFFANFAGYPPQQTAIATNNMGVKFSTVAYSYLNPVSINNFAHVYCNDIITDTLNWTRINGSFIADSAYSYIMVGNFFDDNHTDTINVSGPYRYAYYYIDDICVTTDSLFNENWMGIKEQSKNKEEITIYPNPCINQLNVKFSNLPNANTTISLLDITGKILLQATTTENEYTFNTEKLAKGLYLVKVDNGSGVALTKVTKE